MNISMNCQYINFSDSISKDNTSKSIKVLSELCNVKKDQRI